MPQMKVYRSTVGGAVGALLATAQFWFIPPTVMQEILLNLCHIAVSIDMASYIGTILVGAAGTLATRYAPSQPDAPPTTT